MNVLNIVYTFNSGGVERLIIDILNCFNNKNNINSNLCIISEDYDDNLLDQIIYKDKIYKLKKNFSFRKMSYLFQLIKIIRKDKIKAIHVHQGTLMNFFLLLKILIPSIEIFYTVHDTYIFSNLSKKNQFIAKLICKKIITISDAVSDNVLKCISSTKKVKRVYNGVNFSRFSVKSKLNLKDCIKIYNVARFYPQKKGQDLLIQALKYLRDDGYNIEVYFIGGNIENRDDISKMKEFSKNIGVYNFTHFIGNSNDVPNLLLDSDIFCLPSRYEGFGISVVEALSAGIPVVASDIAGLNEVMYDKKFGELFISGDAKELANKIKFVINNYDNYSPQYISNAIRKKFSIETMCDELLKVYNN